MPFAPPPPPPPKEKSQMVYSEACVFSEVGHKDFVTLHGLYYAE